jgi:hypothetical protein
MAWRRDGSAAKLDKRLHWPPPEQGRARLGAFYAGTGAYHLRVLPTVNGHRNEAEDMGEQRKVVADNMWTIESERETEDWLGRTNISLGAHRML